MLRTRLPLVATFISAIFVVSLFPANSASIAGTKCTKLNSTKIASNIKYTCVKSGKKLVWNKGVTISKSQSPLPSPAPVKSENQSKTEIKAGDQCTSAERGTSKTSNSIILTCLHDGISAFLWTVAESPVATIKPVESPSATPQSGSSSTSQYYGKVYEELAKYLSPNHDNLKINWHISPKAAALPHQGYLDSVELGARLWYRDFNNSEINIILFSQDDAVWIDNKQRELMGNWLVNPSEQLQSNRMKTQGCNIGGFYFPNIVLACVKDDPYEVDNFGQAMMFVHEFTHLSGFTSKQLTSKPLADQSRFRPGWVEEGMATFMGFFGASQLDKNFPADRTRFLQNIRTSVNRNSSADIVTMFKQLEATDYATNVQDSYFLGSLAFEYLGNKYGVAKIFETNRVFFQGNSWGIAFKQTYGITLDELYSNIAEAVVTKFWQQ